MAITLSGLRCRGFTLIELIATLVVLGALIAVGAPLMAGGFRNYFQAVEVAREDADGRLALERLLRDVRRIRSPGDVGTMTANQISFVDINGRTVSFASSGTTLTRQENGGTVRVLANRVSGFALSYLQDDGQTTASSAAEIYYIVVQLTISGSGNSVAVNATYIGSARPFNA